MFWLPLGSGRRRGAAQGFPYLDPARLAAKTGLPDILYQRE